MESEAMTEPKPERAMRCEDCHDCSDPWNCQRPKFTTHTLWTYPLTEPTKPAEPQPDEFERRQNKANDMLHDTYKAIQQRGAEQIKAGQQELEGTSRTGLSETQQGTTAPTAVAGAPASVDRPSPDCLAPSQSAARETPEDRGWLPLLEMFPDSYSLLQGAAGEDAMNVGDVIKIVNELSAERLSHDTDQRHDEEKINALRAENAALAEEVTRLRKLLQRWRAWENDNRWDALPDVVLSPSPGFDALLADGHALVSETDAALQGDRPDE